MSVVNKGSVYEDLEKWYVQERPLYENLAHKVCLLIKDILDSHGIEYHSITSRAKEVDSVVNKAKLKKYKNPKSDIQDFAGIRIITFVKSDVLKACELIKPQFKIDEKNSSDKGEELGEDRVGYRSVHYIASFNDSRINLPEYNRFNGLCFEIQIRTLLEHAWADISHDRTYKFNNNLTNENDIRRRFALAAASLEMVDREFDRLASEIEKFSLQVANDTLGGDLNYVIDGTSLVAYLESKFGEQITYGIPMLKVENRVLEELNIMGLTTLADLDKVIKELVGEDFYKLVAGEDDTFIGLLRNILILKFKEEYFENAWRDAWNEISEEEIEYFNKFGLDYLELATKFGLEMEEEEGYEEDFYPF
ncbi:GTP pyrophosphokinase [Lysinibacillus fusiformis]